MTIVSSRRFTLSFLMRVVFLIAVDFGIVRYLSEARGVVTAAITLPMINILILTIPRLKGVQKAYWFGFQNVGWAIVVTFAYLGQPENDWFFLPLIWTVQMLPRGVEAVNGLGENVAFVILLTYPAIIYTLPQILLADLAGRLNRQPPKRASNEPIPLTGTFEDLQRESEALSETTGEDRTPSVDTPP